MEPNRYIGTTNAEGDAAVARGKAYGTQTPTVTPPVTPAPINNTQPTAPTTPFSNSNFTLPNQDAYPSSALAPSNGMSDLLKLRKGYEDNVLKYLTPSSTELGLQQQLNSAKQLSRQAQLELSRNVEKLQTDGGLTQDISNNFVSDTGRRYARTLADLGVAQSGAADQLGVAQNLRQSQLQGSQFLYDSFNKLATPVAVGAGTSLVNPYTGQASFGGSGAYADKQAQDTYFNLAQTYPDANIPAYNTQLSPQQNLQIAQQSAQTSPYFQTKQNSYSSIQLPNGTLAFLDKKSGAVFDSSGQSIGNLPAGGFGSSLSDPVSAASFKADSDSLTKQTSYLDTATRATNISNANFDSLITLMQQNGINQSNVPIVNQLTNKVKAGLTDPGAVATYLSSIVTLRNEYAQVLSKGENLTDGVRNEAKAVIPDDLSPAQLGPLRARINTETTNAIKEASAQVNTIKGRLNSKPSSSNSPGVIQTKVGAVDNSWFQ